jgi:hypothetical protein
MARYINLDEAIKHLQFDCKAKYPLSYCNGISVAIREIGKLPTADVVPKSEVEKLQEAFTEQNKALAKVLQSNADMYAYAKAEVAREIFEEFEKGCSFSVMTCNEREIPETKVYNISSLKLAELKNKYTEGNV